ncbi:MAG: DUF402 domain-containing protein [Acidobacteriota bacterium]|nr:DUF402 domain-containing protein [Acidobacteriota bacterium]
MKNLQIRVEALKYDRSTHRSWDCSLVSETEELWELVGIFINEIRHPLLGVIRPNTVSHEFYWKNRWYNIFRFHEPEGKLRNFYCNVNMPPVLNGNVLTYVDLDIDILVATDLSFEIVDLDEFEENAEKHNYPAEVVKKAHSSVAELVEMIHGRKFPFNL